jgi:hypothetical protein
VSAYSFQHKIKQTAQIRLLIGFGLQPNSDMTQVNLSGLEFTAQSIAAEPQNFSGFCLVAIDVVERFVY